MADDIDIGIPLHPDEHLRHLEVNERHFVDNFNWVNTHSREESKSTPVELVEIMEALNPEMAFACNRLAMGVG